LLVERKLIPALKSTVDAFVLIEDEALRDESLGFVQALRERGVSVEYSLTPAKGDKQFKRALELSARFTIRSQSGTGTWMVKEMKDQQQVEMPRSDAVQRIVTALKSN
jgi:histidyl-tRNA synthetase